MIRTFTQLIQSHNYCTTPTNASKLLIIIISKKNVASQPPTQNELPNRIVLITHCTIKYDIHNKQQAVTQIMNLIMLSDTKLFALHVPYF